MLTELQLTELSGKCFNWPTILAAYALVINWHYWLGGVEGLDGNRQLSALSLVFIAWDKIFRRIVNGWRSRTLLKTRRLQICKTLRQCLILLRREKITTQSLLWAPLLIVRVFPIMCWSTLQLFQALHCLVSWQQHWLNDLRVLGFKLCPFTLFTDLHWLEFQFEFCQLSNY